jgi:hypothetical protein
VKNIIVAASDSARKSREVRGTPGLSARRYKSWKTQDGDLKSPLLQSGKIKMATQRKTQDGGVPTRPG